eukprot:6247312-Amphidinium_carterae.1
MEGLLLHNHVVVDSVSDTLPAAIGRILALELDTLLCKKAVVIVAIHLQPTETLTWAQVVSTLHDYTQGILHSTIILVGDFNMDLAVADRIIMPIR